MRSERAVEAVVAANGLGCGCAQSHSTAQQGLSHASCASEGCLNGDAPLTETLGIQAGGVITPYLIYPQTTDQSEAEAYDTIRGKVVLVPLISGQTPRKDCNKTCYAFLLRQAFEKTGAANLVWHRYFRYLVRWQLKPTVPPITSCSGVLITSFG